MHGNRPGGAWTLDVKADDVQYTPGTHSYEGRSTPSTLGIAPDACGSAAKAGSDAVYAIEIVPYGRNHGLRAGGNAVYARETGWYSPDHELYAQGNALYGVRDVIGGREIDTSRAAMAL